MNDNANQAPTGLTSAGVLQSRQKYGSNNPRGRDLSTIKSVLRSIFSVFNIIMAILIAILFTVGEGGSGKFIGIVAAVNTVVEVIQEIRAKMIVKKLSKIMEKKARVIRDEKQTEIPVTEIVINDVITLSSGDRVPVDGEMVETAYAEFDESILTGELKYISKKVGDEVRAGSFVAAGSCYYRVTKLAKDSYIQTLTKQVGSFAVAQSPLQSQINSVIKALTYMTIFFITLLVAEGLIQDNQKQEIILNSSVLVTTLVPQGLVLITTISFAYGAMRIAKNQGIVQRLSAIEAMANTKVVCMDKTGTLTKNALEVKEAKWIQKNS